MKENFEKYLRAIGITKPLAERIGIIYDFFLEIHPFEIDDIFVEEYLKEDGTRIYENLIFVSKKIYVEATRFIERDKMLIIPIYKKIISYGIEKQDYDFKTVTAKSRLKINFSTPRTIPGEVSLKASRENCEYLKDIYHRYIIPNSEQ